MQIKALGYVGINATNLKAWAEFGQDVLGMRFGPGSEDGAQLLRMDERAYRIALHSSDRDGLRYVGWEVPSGDALEEAYEELEAAGVEAEWGTAEECTARQVRGLVHCADPYGTPLELFSGGLDLNEPFLPTRPISGFVTGDVGLGHVVLGVPELEPGQRFYTKVLGFRVSDFMGDRLVFFHCNPRHHSLALGRIGQGLSHIMVETRNMDDVGSTYDLCQAKGVPISRSLGRHSNDLMFSFYMESPGGFSIEYGWNGRLVDDATWTVKGLARGSLWGHQPASERARERAAAMAAGGMPR